jgi:hypothetical protein
VPILIPKSSSRIHRRETVSTFLPCPMRFALISLAAVLMGFFLLPARRLLAWGGTAHSCIVDAALASIPAQDRIAVRLGGEVRHLRNTVEMGDWVNSLIVADENWHVTTEDFPLVSSEYFGNDYLLFPGAPRVYSHIMPDVTGTYTPFFLRTLQALRTEDSTNASRWMGALLHFVTDSGSPPHTIPVLGPNHTKMENWLDASKIDLRGYQPALLGRTDAEAVAALQMRMAALIARDKIIGQKMVPYAEKNDRTNLEPLAMDCAAETARVAADVIHTLLVLTASGQNVQEHQAAASLFVIVTAPALPEHPLLPAKLVLLGTEYSTLSESVSVGKFDYAASFRLSHLPPGRYRAAVERPGAVTLFSGEIVLEAGREFVADWKLASANENRVQNPDFALRWVRPDAPDHWHLDTERRSWVSDNMPVTASTHYLASTESSGKTSETPQVHLEWMAQHWKTTDDAAVSVGSGAPVDMLVPVKAVYARFVIDGIESPDVAIRSLSFVRSTEPATSRKPGS